jgi:hypothetical protein
MKIDDRRKSRRCVFLIALRKESCDFEKQRLPAVFKVKKDVESSRLAPKISLMV